MSSAPVFSLGEGGSGTEQFGRTVTQAFECLALGWGGSDGGGAGTLTHAGAGSVPSWLGLGTASKVARCRGRLAGAGSRQGP